MNATAGGKNRLLVLATSTILVLALVLLASFMSIAGAQTEDPPLPSEITLIEGTNNEIPAVDTVNLGPEWRPVFGETFESTNWVAKWDVNIDGGSASTGRKWGAQSIVNDLNPTSTKSGWGICKDITCSDVDPIAPNYPAGVKSYLVAGPFDLSRADDALVDLDLFYEANSADKFTVAVSENRQTFVEQLTVVGNINNGQWEERSVSLSTYVGKDSIWVAFIFESTTSASKMGAMIDDISIWTKGEAGVFMPYIAYGFTPTPVPATPTATPQPGGGNFEQNFTNSINPWDARRWTKGTAYSVTHDGGSDDGRQGFLNVLVNTANSHYVIASPLIAGPKPPYNIETMVKLRSDRNTGDQYGIIFGGNYTGGACPAPDFSTCFTQYYEMRVRFYYDQQLDRDRMEMKLKRIDSHNANNDNSGPDLIEWTRVKGVDENGFIEWDITVEANGKIKISANDQPVESATDSKYINNPYFGVIVRTEDEKDSEARFDYFKIESIK